jgi:ATP-binding cassette subfamily B protein
MDQSSEHRRLVVAQLRPGRGAALALLAAIGAMTALPLLAPQLTRRIIDGAIADEPTGSLITLAVVYLAVALGGQVARVATAWVASVLAWDGTNRLRERLAEHALALDLAYHGGHTPGEMIERVDGDVVALADFMVTFLLDVVASLLLLAGVLVLVTLADVRIGVALVVYVVLLAALVAPLQRRAVPSASAARSSVAALFG